MNIPNIFAAQANRAGNRIIEPGDESDQRALSRAILSCDGYMFACRYAK
jgi:hypothetical protein